MKMFVTLDFISGMMIGIEYLWEDKVLVIDLAILRVFIGQVPKGM